jgi:hypothetical protein
MSPSAGAGRVLLAFIVAFGLLVLPSADAQLWDNVDGRLGSLAPDNLNADHPEPGFDLTGTWYISGEWRFLPLPTLQARGAATARHGRAGRRRRAARSMT